MSLLYGAYHTELVNECFSPIEQCKVLENLLKGNKFNSPTILLLLFWNNHHKYSALAPTSSYS